VDGDRAPAEAVAVRELRPDEWREARDLRLRALADEPTAFLRTLAEEAAFGDDVWRDRATVRDDRATFVAEADGELVGSATCLVGPGDGATLVAMWVAPGHRRRGLGRALVGSAVAWAEENGAARVVLDVNERLEPAVSLYRRAGFRPTGGRLALPTQPGSDAVELSLELPS
jgi:GNAT superfamily N-acetyltransferase